MTEATAAAQHQLLPWPEVRAILWARCGGRCELCSRHLEPSAWDAHHRQLRSQGGPDCPCNGVALHPRCHTLGRTAVHVQVAMATLAGFVVPSWDDPRRVSVQVPRIVTALDSAVSLACGGTYV